MKTPMLVDAAELRELVRDLLQGKGLPLRDAGWMADALVDADLSGTTTHGTERVPQYLSRLDAEMIVAAPTLEVLQDDGATMRLDGGNGFGQVTGTWLTQVVLEKVASTGVVVATMRASNHLGALGYYVRMAAERGYITFLVQNTVPNMAPFGGADAHIGNNPFAFGLPTSFGWPMVLDISCSRVARGNVILAAKKDEAIPEDWALDHQGRPTTDPRAALEGAMRAFGDHKGSGLAIVMGALAGVLSGGNYGMDVPAPDDHGRLRDVGHFVLVLDPERFLERGAYAERITRYIEQIKDARPVPGHDEVLVPGEGAYRRRVAHRRDGVPIRGDLWHELQDLMSTVEREKKYG
jgi:LDH2 family malate/lactate/ureidoglycolate dehydrogenase